MRRSSNPSVPCLVVILLSLFFSAAPVFPAPGGATVSQGSARVTRTGSNTDIEQTSPRAVINWQSLDVAQNERVQFRQPAGGVALNRILAQTPTTIAGSIKATGQILLLNPNGILFSEGSRIDVGSLIASTSALSDTAFMAGQYLFQNAARTGAGIVNKGSITASEHGTVALVAPFVANDGLIAARMGKVLLGAADSFTLDLTGDGLINLQLDARHLGKQVDSRGNRVGDLLAQTQAGKIVADGGNVAFMTPVMRDALLTGAINLKGVIRADRMAESNGEIRLYAGSGQTNLDAQLATRGSETSTGGKIAIEAQAISMSQRTRLDAGVGGKVMLEQNAFPVGAAEAEVVSASLRSGSNVLLSARTGDLTTNATIDGRGQHSGGSLSLQTRGDLLINRDIYTENGPVRLVSGQGQVRAVLQNVVLQEAVLDAAGRIVQRERYAPLIYAAPSSNPSSATPETLSTAGIQIDGAKGVQTYGLVTGGQIEIKSAQGPVNVYADLGFDFQLPVGGVKITAGKPADIEDAERANPSQTAIMDGVVLSDVRLAAGGDIEIDSWRNVRIYPRESVSGQYTAYEGWRSAWKNGQASVKSAVLGDLGKRFFDSVNQRPKSDRYYVSVYSLSDPCIGLGKCLVRIAPPGFIPPGPGSVRKAREDVPIVDFPEIDMPTPLVLTADADAVSAAIRQSQSVQSRRSSSEENGAEAAEPLDEEADIAVGGRGVALDADLGRTPPVKSPANPFVKPTHVARITSCDRSNAGSGYFRKDVFGAVLQTGC